MEKLKNYLYRIFSVLLVASLFSGSFQSMVYASETEELQTQEIQQIDEEPEEEPENEIPEETQEEPEEETPDIFEITYMMYDGENHPENPSTYEEGTEVVLKEPTKEGYLFKGWYLESRYKNRTEGISEETSGNQIFHAKWKPIEYTITYHLDGGNNNYKNPAVYDTESSTIILRKPAKVGYTFCGWYLEETFENQIKNIPEGFTGDLELYAKWEITDYRLTYSLGDGIVNIENNPTTYRIDSPTIIFENPSRVGYTFQGWYLESACKTEIKQLETGSFGNKILYAKWVPIKYSIDYKLNGGKNHSKNPKVYDITSATISFKEPTREGYTFEGWYLEKSFENEIKNIPKGSTGDLELFAKWKLIEYTISYVGIQETDEHLNPVVYDVETETIYLKEPTKTGYVFVGWFTDSKYKNEVSKVPKGSTGNKTFYARWAPDEYTIKFHGNGASKGSMSPLKDCKYDEKCRLPKNEYKRLWYTFVGWNTKKNGSGIAFDDEESVKELIADESRTITLYAQWKKKFDKKGIDVSEYQGTINWNKVKDSGVDFAMLRVVKGLTGSMKTDAQFERNYRNARNAGINVGVYRYTYAKNPDQARKEAYKVLEVLDGRELDYPVVLDIEDSGLITNVSSDSRRSDIVLAFQEVIEDAGYDFAMYASLSWIKDYLDMDKLDDVDLWLARWRSLSKGPGYSGKGNLVMWQYTDSGSVPGISGNVDLDISY